MAYTDTEQAFLDGSADSLLGIEPNVYGMSPDAALSYIDGYAGFVRMDSDQADALVLLAREGITHADLGIAS